MYIYIPLVDPITVMQVIRCVTHVGDTGGIAYYKQITQNDLGGNMNGTESWGRERIAFTGYVTHKF